MLAGNIIIKLCYGWVKIFNIILLCLNNVRKKIFSMGVVKVLLFRVTEVREDCGR